MEPKMQKLNVDTWVEENKSDFKPPVCNKLMFGHGQLKVMFIGGPNIRKDYHIEKGEELFFQIKGDMVLKIMEKGKPKDVKIKEGEMFLLPGKIPHSPQRFEGTVGLVIERERAESELDGLRYYCPDDETNPLWEKFFYCYDLGTQLGPVIQEYFSSQEHKTGKPSEESVVDPTPVELDITTEVPSPINFKQWLNDNQAVKTTKTLFNGIDFKIQVAFPEANTTIELTKGKQAWLWQQAGNSSCQYSDDKSVNLHQQDCIIFEDSQEITIIQDSQGIGLIVTCFKP